MNTEDFVLSGKIPMPRFKSYELQQVDISECINRTGKFALRKEYESWEEYRIRKVEAVNRFKDLAYGKVYSKNFIFSSMPDLYLDYQWGKLSEFRKAGFGVSIKYDVATSSSQASTNTFFTCISDNIISSLFRVEDTISQLMMRNDTYLEYQKDSNGLINCFFWLARTGLKVRSRALYDTAIGTKLTLRRNGTFLNCNTYEVINSDGKPIGDIDFGYDAAPDNKTSLEYWELFGLLETTGYLEVENVTLHKVLKSRTKYYHSGKPRAEICIKYKMVKPLETASCTEEYLQYCANTMRLLASIDYNRKLDIISGKIPAYYDDLSTLFPNQHIATNESNLICAQPAKTFKLDAVNLLPYELEEFWNIFCPVYCCILHHRKPDYSDALCGIPFGEARFAITNHLILKIEYQQISQIEKTDNRNLLLSIYRNDE